MRELRKIEVDHKTITIVDFSDLKEGEMIALLDKLRDTALAEKKRLLILSLYNTKNFATPKFMRHVEGVTREAIHLIDKMVIVGISDTQKFILKGYNLLFQKQYPVFDTQEEGIQYLISETKTD